MKFLDDIDNETLIVCPSSIKSNILKRINLLGRLVNVKLYTLDELKKNIYFDYDKDAILYLMEKYNYTCEVSKYYLDNLYYVEDKKYDNSKLDFLVELKKELVDNNLLIFNDLFLKFNKNKNVLVYGYDYIDSFNKKILSNFDYKIIDKELYDFNKNVYGFDTLEDEVLFVINEIISLINNGVSLNNIYLVNLDSEYNNEINRLFKMFNLPVDIDISSSILTSNVGKAFIDYLRNSKSFEESLNFIKENYDDSSYSIFVDTLNDYVGLDYSIDKIIECIEYDLKNKHISRTNFSNLICVSDLSNSYFDSDDYVFVLGFNQGVLPKTHKDEDYISDDLKTLVGLDNVSIINKYERDALIRNFKSIKDCKISYKLHYLDNEYYPSNMLNDSLFNIISSYDLKYNNSLIYSKIKLSILIDDLIKYGKKSNELDLLYSNLSIPYSMYDNSYKKINNSDLKKYLDNKLTLSYSNLNTFYLCQFRYYIDNVLKLNKYEETFDTLVGSLFHYVLSHVYNSDFDLDRDYEYYLKDKELSSKEKFFLEKLKKELKIICDFLLEFYHDTGLTKVFTEKNIKIDKSSDIEVVFKGIVDKIMYKEFDGKTYVSIVDYKTGNAEIDINNSIYGIGMQLIIYLYLITKSNLFENYSFVGFYLQRILSGEVNIEKDKSYLDLKYNNLKLYGYSTDSELSLSRFDPTYEDSKYIKSMKITKNGFSAYSKVLSEEDMNKLVLLVDEKIDNARDNILDCDFSINPKKYSDDDDIVGCKFCKYRDICFRKNEDIVNLKKYKNTSFLSEVGDDNV